MVKKSQQNVLNVNKEMYKTWWRNKRGKDTPLISWNNDDEDDDDDKKINNDDDEQPGLSTAFVSGAVPGLLDAEFGRGPLR